MPGCRGIVKGHGIHSDTGGDVFCVCRQIKSINKGGVVVIVVLAVLVVGSILQGERIGQSDGRGSRQTLSGQ